jgi:hypothetical protein
MLVGLSNGYLICFNLYLQLLNSKANLSQDDLKHALVRLSNVFKVGNVFDSIRACTDDLIQLSSDKGVFLLSQDSQKPLKDLKITRVEHSAADSDLDLVCHVTDSLYLV